MVHNSAHFQQFCRPGTGGNYFVRAKDVPRSETACVICAQKGWREHRFELNLFGTCRDDGSSTEAADLRASSGGDRDSDEEDHHTHARVTLLRRREVHYVQSQGKMVNLSNVNRYSGRWPLIPEE